jgi:hypothetical protein
VKNGKSYTLRLPNPWTGSEKFENSALKLNYFFLFGVWVLCFLRIKREWLGKIIQNCDLSPLL